ncbi:4'-phosphopantetheinyl transferase family protein [Halomonas sp. THAF12]|uniref:4'-phosphopantetheinyl transferase family protein n=1 Tax=Halomonas sp. B23F22_10 TaxID=3459515 RepID=UPI00373F46D2
MMHWGEHEGGAERLQRLPGSVPAQVEVWRLALDPTAPLAAADWALLSDGERARVGRLRRHEDRLRAVATRAALRRRLAVRLDAEPRGLRLVINRHGKPRLPDPAGLAFNVSHAGDFALIALSTQGEVGIDIERRLASTDEQALAALVLSPRERRPDMTARLGFHERWVAKEAVLKALGLGIGDHLQALSVLPGGGVGEARYRLQHARADWPRLEAWALAAPAGYAAALALSHH